MVWPIFPAIVAIIAVATFWHHTSNNPEILEDVADAALVRCTISDMLYERFADAGLNWNQMLILNAMQQGERVSAGDVRDIAKHAKEVSKSVAWGAICHITDR